MYNMYNTIYNYVRVYNDILIQRYMIGRIIYCTKSIDLGTTRVYQQQHGVELDFNLFGTVKTHLQPYT